ncbi:class I SAM-dependent methyltransferase [Streptomyces sp. NPDC050485]|uniref:class I SAM-dependent methyltransferase n=1 Tax=Streptomyces sp. NPDC050485 TaxID=3365617 RepID=UPI00378A756B
MTSPTNTPTTAGLDPVAATARLTAALRARESARPDRLFDDPLAARLAGDPGRALLDRIGEVPTIPVRTRFYDDAITRLTADDGIRQIVLVAAGMDTRAHRLHLPADSTLFELDRPELLRLKGTLLAEAAPPRCSRRPVGVDLAADWTSALRTAGFRANQPTCWLAEGLTPYLEAADVHRLLDRITELSAPGSHLLADFVGRSLLDNPSVRPMLALLADWGAAWRYGIEEPETLLTERHWRPEVTRIGEAGHALGRWPFPDAPRGTPGVPQGYLVHGRR